MNCFLAIAGTIAWRPITPAVQVPRRVLSPELSVFYAVTAAILEEFDGHGQVHEEYENGLEGGIDVDAGHGGTDVVVTNLGIDPTSDVLSYHLTVGSNWLCRSPEGSSK